MVFLRRMTLVNYTSRKMKIVSMQLPGVLMLLLNETLQEGRYS